MIFIIDNKNIVLSMWNAIIQDKFTPNWCLIVVINYSFNKMNFMPILILSPIHPVRRKWQIACSSVTNRARKDFKKAKWSLEKTDLGGSSFQICIYYRFPWKSGNAYRFFRHNKRLIQNIYIRFSNNIKQLRGKW